MAALTWINLDWFAIRVPATCIGSVGFRLALKGFGPLAALLAGLAIVCFVALRERELEHGEPRRARRGEVLAAAQARDPAVEVQARAHRSPQSQEPPRREAPPEGFPRRKFSEIFRKF